VKIKLFSALAWAAVLLFTSIPVMAHHGASVYESDKLTTLTGTVTEFKFMNPHSEIFFDVKDDTGKVQKWVAEAASVASLSRSGWTRNTLKPGDPITIIGNVAKNGTFALRLSAVVLPNGKKITMERGEDYAQ
jgi:hypothetical protein